MKCGVHGVFARFWYSWYCCPFGAAGYCGVLGMKFGEPMNCGPDGEKPCMQLVFGDMKPFCCGCWKPTKLPLGDGMKPWPVGV